MENKFFTSKNVAFLGILIALVIVLQLFASSIPMFGITLNFSLIPIALAAILLGWIGGAVVGFACGLVVFITTALLGQEYITANLFQTNPIILTVMCIGKTTVAGAVSGLLFKAISKRNELAAVAVSSIAIPVVNTTIYTLGMVLMKDSLAVLMKWDSSSAWFVFVTVITIIWLNFVLEVVINTVFTPLTYRVIRALDKVKR